MFSDNIRLDRLQEIAEHLLKGDLAHDVFDFNRINFYVEQGENKCGTKGCAVGEFPAIWPNDWIWSGNGIRPKNLKDPSPGFSTFGYVREWLGLNIEESGHLFHPESQIFGKNQLSSYADRFQVAQNIFFFILLVKDVRKSVSTHED